MKFGKNLIRVVELSDPEWGPYWINYKFMKKKINEIVERQGGRRQSESNLSEISKSATEVDFFRLLKTELKKTSDFFSSAQQLCRIRHQRVRDGFVMLQDNTVMHDKNTWTRLLMACVKFYKDVLLLENFAIMNYCGFSKILKKHDKSTGFSTREAFMRNVMSQQNFTHYPYVLDLLKQSEKLFADIQEMERYVGYFNTARERVARILMTLCISQHHHFINFYHLHYPMTVVCLSKTKKDSSSKPSETLTIKPVNSKQRKTKSCEENLLKKLIKCPGDEV